MTVPVAGVLFDKDGTLFDFNASWAAWAHDFMQQLSNGDAEQEAALCAAIGLDTGAQKFDPSSPVIAGTQMEISERICSILTNRDPHEFVHELNIAAAKAEQVAVLPLVAFFENLGNLGLSRGVATNDGELPAKAHLQAHGLLPHLEFLAGYDSGHGGKPGPGMCLAFAQSCDRDPAHCLMIGDSTHDLLAGQAAGMRTVAVLTGPAPAEVLAPHATWVLDSITALPTLLEQIGVKA